jgi:hypothetical protein
MRLYFSYASKMDRAHAMRLCRGTEALGIAHAENLIFYIAVGALRRWRHDGIRKSTASFGGCPRRTW